MNSLRMTRWEPGGPTNVATSGAASNATVNAGAQLLMMTGNAGAGVTPSASKPPAVAKKSNDSAGRGGGAKWAVPKKSQPGAAAVAENMPSNTPSWTEPLNSPFPVTVLPEPDARKANVLSKTRP